MTSINYYPNGTPINPRGQALEAQRLRESSRSGRDNSRRYTGFARTNCRDAQGIFGGARYNLLKYIKVPGQTRLERKDMAAKLKRHGLLKRSEYATINMFIKSLQYLNKRDYLLFFTESRVDNFSVRAWIGDSVAEPLDFLLASSMYSDIAERLSSISYVSQPHRMSKHGRDLTVSQSRGDFYRSGNFSRGVGVWLYR